MARQKGVDHATPVLTEATETCAEKVSATRTHVEAMKASPEWGSATDLQKSAGSWLKAASELAANLKKIADLLKQLAAAFVEQQILVRRWTSRKQACLHVASAHCDGSKDLVLSLGFGVAGRRPRPPAGVPEGLHGKRSKTLGTATVAWTTHRGDHKLYQVQHATRPEDAATHSIPITVSKGTFELAGQTPGAIIHFRVMGLDAKLPAGQTDWTPWVAVMVSS